MCLCACVLVCACVCVRVRVCVCVCPRRQSDSNQGNKRGTTVECEAYRRRPSPPATPGANQSVAGVIVIHVSDSLQPLIILIREYRTTYSFVDHELCDARVPSTKNTGWGPPKKTNQHGAVGGHEFCPAFRGTHSTSRVRFVLGLSRFHRGIPLGRKCA